MKVISFPGSENKRIKPTFEEFYKAYYKKVLFFLNKKLDNMTEAEDLASNIFLYAYRIYDNYDPSKSAPQTWIFTITRTRLINYYRDHHIDVDISELENVLTYEETEMEKAAYLQEVRNTLARAIKTLQPIDQKIVILSYFKGKNSNEIGELLSMNPGTVRVRLKRALEKLEKHCEALRV